MPIGFRAFLEIERPDINLIEAYREIPSSNIGDCVKCMNCMFGGIRSYNKINLVGPAFTVKVPAGDNLMAQELLVPMAKVTLQKTDNPERKTSYDLISVFPNNETQPEFGQAMVRAARAGVQITYYGCHVESDSIIITGVVGDTARYLK